MSSRRTVLLSLITFCLASGVGACSGNDRHQSDSYEVVDRFPHDPHAYTQGLLQADSVLIESTGLYGYSQVRRVDLRSGRVLASRPLGSKRFGEGLTRLNGRLYQLTWKEGVAYTYDEATLSPGDSFHYVGEGWGLATDGTSLIMSDGSDSLRFLSPATFQVQRTVHVRYEGAPVYELNELEYVEGELLANVYKTSWVLRIDPSSGAVREVIDFSDLYPDRAPSAEVMNGIAIAPDGHELLLTGKYWPVVFQVRLLNSKSSHVPPS
jgi:glutaminyl-peptide cyclotransferase